MDESVLSTSFSSAMSTVQSHLLEILHESEAHRREVFSAFDVAVRTAEQLQTVRALELDRNRRASKANEEQIQERLKAVRARKTELKQQLRVWDAKQAQSLADVMTRASACVDLPKVLEDATNTVQRHRAERVDAQIRTVALEEELRIVKEQQSEAEHARMTSAGELEIVKMQYESLKEQHQVLEHEMAHARTLKEASAESARFYKEQLDESTFRLQAAEGHIVRLQQALEALQRDAATEDSLLKSLQARWAAQSKHIEEAAIEVASMRANVLADVATQTDYYAIASRNAQGSSVLHAQLAASWRREEKWRSEKVELLQQLQATATPDKCSLDPLSPDPHVLPASAPASYHCTPVQPAASTTGDWGGCVASVQAAGPPARSAAQCSDQEGAARTPTRTSAARSSGSVAQVDTPMPASPGRGAAGEWRSPDSPAVSFPTLPPAAPAVASLGPSGLDDLMHAAAEAERMQGASMLQQGAAGGVRSSGADGAAMALPLLPVAALPMDGICGAGGGASTGAPVLRPMSAPWASAGVRAASGRPPRPPGLFSAQHLQPKPGGELPAAVSASPAQSTRGLQPPAVDGGEDVWDAFITSVAYNPGEGAQAQEEVEPQAGGLSGAEDMLATLLEEVPGDDDAALLAMVQACRAGGGPAPDGDALMALDRGMHSGLPLSPVRGKRQRSPEADSAAAAVPVYVPSGGCSAPGGVTGHAAAERGGGDTFDQSIGACLRAISLPSVSSSAVSDLPTPAALRELWRPVAGPFEDVFGALDVEASSAWGDACSAEVEEVSVDDLEPTLAHGCGPGFWDCSGAAGVRVVRHGGLASGAVQAGAACASLLDVGEQERLHEASPFGSVLLEEGGEVGGRGGAGRQLVGGAEFERGVGGLPPHSTRQLGWMDDSELVCEMLEQGLSLSG